MMDLKASGASGERSRLDSQLLERGGPSCSNKMMTIGRESLRGTPSMPRNTSLKLMRLLILLIKDPDLLDQEFLTLKTIGTTSRPSTGRSLLMELSRRKLSEMMDMAKKKWKSKPES